MSTADHDALRRAAGWVEHLRNGGATSWALFTGASDPAPADPSTVDLPGAAHLELVRRLNLAGGAETAAHRALVDRVLRVPAPGRGQPDLDLLGVPSRSRFGAPPIDPVDVPTEELLRVAAGALAETVTALDPGPPRRQRRPRRPWHRGLRLAGNPMTVAGVRSGLAQIGHVTGRRFPVAVVLADDLAVMLADTWSMRLQLGKDPAWPGWLAHAERNDALPPALKLGHAAGRQAEKWGPENVHIVVGPDPGPTISELIEAPEPVPVGGNRLSAEALEVVRHVNEVLRVMVLPEQHQRLLDLVLLPLLAGEQGPRRTIPEARVEWVNVQAIRLRDELSEGRYPVHGDLDALLPRAGERAPNPTGEGTLDVSLRTLLKVKEGL